MNTDIPFGKDANSAAQPVALLMAALAGCKVATASFVARHMKPRFPTHTLKFDLYAERDDRGALTLPLSTKELPPARVQRVWGNIKVIIHDDQLVESQSRLLELRDEVNRRCPVADMFHASGCKLDIEWSFNVPDKRDGNEK